MKEFYFETRGVYYRTNDFSNERLTLLFIHGLSGSSSAWALYENKFKDTYNIISYDLRGHGKSKRFNNYDDYAIENFVSDIYFLLSLLQVKKVFIISHSFGTLFALDFVLKYQHMVLGAVFLSPNFAINKKWLGIIITPLIIVLKIFLSDNSSKKGKHIDYSKYIDTGDWNIPRMIQDVGNTGIKPYLYCTRQVCDFKREELLTNVKIPVLIVHGEKDTIFSVKSSELISQKIHNVKVIFMREANHILVLNNFSEVSTSIEQFIQAVSETMLV